MFSNLRRLIYDRGSFDESPGPSIGVAMGRPRNGRLSRVRVEFSLPPALAEAVYAYADSADISLSQAGGELLKLALSERTDGRDEAIGTSSNPVVPATKAGGSGTT